MSEFPLRLNFAVCTNLSEQIVIDSWPSSAAWLIALTAAKISARLFVARPVSGSLTFRGSLSPNQTPMPAFAFALPLFEHAPSV